MTCPHPSLDLRLCSRLLPFSTCPVVLVSSRDAPSTPPYKRECGGPHDNEVEDERDEDAEDRPKVVHGVVALVREHYDNCIEEAEECERAEVWEERRLEEPARREAEHQEACRYARCEGYAQVLRGRKCQHG